MKSFILITALLVSSSAFAAAPKNCDLFAKAVAGGTPAQKLKKFLDTQWKYTMNESPEFATYVGYPGLNDKWQDQSLAAIERRKKETRCQLAALKKIPRAPLKDGEKVNYDLSERELMISIEGDSFGAEFMPVTHMGGIQTDSIDLFSSMPVATKKDFKDIIARLDKLPTVVEQQAALMREGLKRKVTPTKLFLPKIGDEIDALTTAKIEDSPLYKPFTDMGAISKEDQAVLQAEAKQVIEQKVYPAFKKFKEFVMTEYIPGAHEYFSWAEMPNGKKWYEFLVKYHTTTRATPEQLHELGLKEVARINDEMLKIKDQVKFKGDLKEFNKFLLTDKRFYYESGEELLTAYRDITKRIDPELTRMFKTLPRLTYGVREIPAFRGASSSGAEYQGGSYEAGRGGWFQANVYDLKSRPKWEMETLAFHEGVPGHHFQISIAQELEGIPEFRKYGGNTAYAEGWALYSESLGQEMGFYKDPYQLYGHYSDEMLRAVRLVVDTGMHSKSWTRQQALDYFRSKMPTTDVDSAIEIDRYITWPGQALAYKVGQLKFRELRDRAHEKLGTAFDVRSFHDVVLGQGSVPMEVLEKVVDRWIDAQKKSVAKTKKI
ncbi:MAG: DUF885 domain-containing protein [Bdellovibrionales bacterium]